MLDKDRDRDIDAINEYISKYGVNKCPIAFVAPSVHAKVPDRVLIESNIKRKYDTRFPKARRAAMMRDLKDNK